MAINIDKSFEYNEKDSIKIDLSLSQDEIVQILQQVCKKYNNISDFVPKYYKHFKIPHNMKGYINAVSIVKEGVKEEVTKQYHEEIHKEIKRIGNLLK